MPKIDIDCCFDRSEIGKHHTVTIPCSAAGSSVHVAHNSDKGDSPHTLFRRLFSLRNYILWDVNGSRRFRLSLLPLAFRCLLLSGFRKLLVLILCNSSALPARKTCYPYRHPFVRNAKLLVRLDITTSKDYETVRSLRKEIMVIGRLTLGVPDGNPDNIVSSRNPLAWSEKLTFTYACDIARLGSQEWF